MKLQRSKAACRLFDLRVYLLFLMGSVSSTIFAFAATATVTNVKDSGSGCLCQAVSDGEAGKTITSFG